MVNIHQMTRNSCDGVWAAENFFKSLCVKTTVITKHVRIVIIEQKKPLNQLYPRYHAIALGIGFPLDKLKKQLYNILFYFLGNNEEVYTSRNRDQAEPKIYR